MKAFSAAIRWIRLGARGCGMQPWNGVPSADMVLVWIPIRQISFKSVVPGRQQILFGVLFEIDLLNKFGYMLRLLFGKIGFQAEDRLVRVVLNVVRRLDHKAEIRKAHAAFFCCRERDG